MKSNLAKNNRGVAAIEMAIVLPILLLIIMAVIEFGVYFLKAQVVQRSVSTISATVQKDPLNATALLATQQGDSLVSFSAAPNFICVKAYADIAAANAGSCISGNWITAAPTGVVAGAPYFIVVRAFAKQNPLTPLAAMAGTVLTDIDVKQVIQVGGGSGWVNVPLSDTSPYDVECEYRFLFNKPFVSDYWGYAPSSNHYYYASYVADNLITNAPSYNIEQGIPSNTKNKVYQYWLKPDGSAIDMAAYGYSVTKIQKKCN